MPSSPFCRPPLLTAVLAASVTGLAACGDSSDPMATGDAGADAGDTTITVGSANFLENELRGEMYAHALTAAGFEVKTNLNIGSREIIYAAMQDGSLDVLPEGLAILDPSPAEDKNTVVVSEQTTTQNNLDTIADLAPYASSMNFGGAPEDKVRYQGLVGLKGSTGSTSRRSSR